MYSFISCRIQNQQTKASCISYIKFPKEISRTIPFTIASKRIKYLGINFHQGGKILVHCKLQSIAEKIKEDTNKLKDISCSWIGKLNIFTMSVLPKPI